MLYFHVEAGAFALSPSTNLNTSFIHGRSSGAPVQYSNLDAAAGKRIPGAARKFGRRAHLVVLLCLLLTPFPNRANSASLKVPFHTVQSMILLDGKVNGNAATFLLDTGANRTIVSTQIYGKGSLALQRFPRNAHEPGLVGYSLRRPANLKLGNHVWVAQHVSVMDLDELKQMLHMDFDGLLGEDILREFHSVRINYKTHTLELEQ